MTDVLTLIDWINDKAKQEYIKEVELLRRQKELTEKEEKERIHLVNEIYDFFKPLFAPSIYTVPLFKYQFHIYTYLKIKCKTDTEIWLTNEPDAIEPMDDSQKLYKQGYDIVKTIWLNKSHMLLDIAKSYEYIEESENEIENGVTVIQS